MQKIINKYKTLIVYSLVSIICFVLDQVLFRILRKVLLLPIIIATIIARIFSSLLNYLLNRDKVFKSKDKTNRTLIYYYLLVLFAMLLSGILVKVIYSVLGIDESLIKMGVDSLIFIMNYFIQKNIIFKG